MFVEGGFKRFFVFNSIFVNCRIVAETISNFF